VKDMQSFGADVNDHPCGGQIRQLPSTNPTTRPMDCEFAPPRRSPA
jgi:hypothetical protein